jgi:hypothetical protein
MKKIASFFIIILCSCGQNRETTKAVEQHALDSTRADSAAKEVKAMAQAMVDSNKHQDSLRNEILKSKPNTILKNSFLQEFYVRDLADVSGNIVAVNIPFNLHVPDCGAPDCYSTDVKFGFKLGDSLVFPEKLQFLEREHGCVNKETKLKGEFQLLEQSKELVIYFSEKPKRTLVLFGRKSRYGDFAFYFRGLERGKINAKSIEDILLEYNEDDSTSIYPFMSWILTTSEYENFLE